MYENIYLRAQDKRAHTQRHSSIVTHHFAVHGVDGTNRILHVDKLDETKSSCIVGPKGQKFWWNNKPDSTVLCYQRVRSLILLIKQRFKAASL
jgi:hypothetical protein